MNRKEVIHDLESINKRVSELLEQLREDEQPKEIDLSSGDLKAFMGAKSILERFSMPVDDEFIKCVLKLCASESINAKGLESVLDRVLYASKTQDIKDIRKYVYSCLHKYNENRKGRA